MISNTSSNMIRSILASCYLLQLPSSIDAANPIDTGSGENGPISNIDRQSAAWTLIFWSSFHAVALVIFLYKCLRDDSHYGDAANYSSDGIQDDDSNDSISSSSSQHGERVVASNPMCLDEKRLEALSLKLQQQQQNKNQKKTQHFDQVSPMFAALKRKEGQHVEWQIAEYDNPTLIHERHLPPVGLFLSRYYLHPRDKWD